MNCERILTLYRNQQDWTKSDGCVFYQNKIEGAYGVGHASFVQSPDQSEWFM
jgi:GH43 family beta-xylosidase